MHAGPAAARRRARPVRRLPLAGCFVSRAGATRATRRGGRARNSSTGRAGALTMLPPYRGSLDDSSSICRSGNVGVGTARNRPPRSRWPGRPAACAAPPATPLFIYLPICPFRPVSARRADSASSLPIPRAERRGQAWARLLSTVQALACAGNRTGRAWDETSIRTAGVGLVRRADCRQMRCLNRRCCWRACARTGLMPSRPRPPPRLKRAKNRCDRPVVRAPTPARPRSSAKHRQRRAVSSAPVRW